MNMSVYLLLGLQVLALLLSGCGPRRIDQVQPIKFQYTFLQGNLALQAGDLDLLSPPVGSAGEAA